MPVNLPNDKGDLPILWAANDNKPSTVKILIQMGADVNGQNDKGSSALHWACRNGHTEVVRVGESLYSNQLCIGLYCIGPFTFSNWHSSPSCRLFWKFWVFVHLGDFYADRILVTMRNENNVICDCLC